MDPKEPKPEKPQEYSCPNIDPETRFPQLDDLNMLLFGQISPPETLKRMEHLKRCEACRLYIRAKIEATLKEYPKGIYTNDPKFIALRKRFFDAVMDFTEDNLFIIIRNRLLHILHKLFGTSPLK